MTDARLLHIEGTLYLVIATLWILLGESDHWSNIVLPIFWALVAVATWAKADRLAQREEKVR